MVLLRDDGYAIRLKNRKPLLMTNRLLYANDGGGGRQSKRNVVLKMFLLTKGSEILVPCCKYKPDDQWRLITLMKMKW